jgi:hypothetical protein
MEKNIIILQNKRILYIGPKFFGYELEIQRTLKDLGAQVTFYDDRPANDFLTKVLIRLKLKLFIEVKIDKYYNKIYNDIKNIKYDYIFVVAPETLDYKKLQQIQLLQKNAKSILYMWDSFENKNSFNTIDLFDKVITFDSNDADKYNLKFLPLFFIKNYENIKDLNNYEYELCFTATAHSDRYEIAKKIEKQLHKFNFKMYSFFYLPSKVMYWVRKLFISKYKYGDINDFSFSSFSQQEIIENIEKSKVILDINHPSQYGLTSRTIEALGANRKLITTNKNIINYDFYNENNILIIDRNNPLINKDFLESNYIKPLDNIYKKYSLEEWLKNIFKIVK